MGFPLAMVAVVVVAVAMALTSSVYGHFIVEKSSIKVLSPASLQQKRDAAIGNFGVPDYGGIMIGSVAYPSKGNSFGCEPFDGDKPFKSASSQPTILLLDRGGLSLSSFSLFLCFF